MRLVPALLLTLMVLGSLPTAEAAINGPRSYRATHDYMPELNAPTFIMVSGAVSADMPSSGGSFGLIATRGAEITGLTKACWTGPTTPLRQCADSPSANLRIVVADGGSFGLKLPEGVEAQLRAEHAVAMFADLAGEANLNSLEMGKSLLAPLVDGTATLRGIPPISTSTIPTPVSDGVAAFAILDAGTTAQVLDGSTLRATLTGKGDPVTFAGTPALTPVQCDMVVLPFLGAGDVAHFEPASHDAAVTGLEIRRINGLMDRLYNANEGQPTNSVPIDEDAFGPYANAAAALFAGAVLRVPTQQASGAEIGFARVSQLQVAGLPGEGLAWSGRASFEIREGHVAGAKDLAGFGVFQLPWWSWVLWLAALGVWITRLVRRPEKENERWDRHKWIGWVASPLMLLLVFILWDLEVRALLGLSLFSGDADGQVLVLVGLLQVGTFFMASFAAMAPLRMLFRNGSLLLGQGTFMGLAGAAASLVGFLFIVLYLRSYLDVIVSQVLAGIS